MDRSISDKKKDFETVFRRNYRSLLYVALDWVDDEEIARDLVSGLFADVWQKFDEVRMEEVDAYLRKILRNRCINYLQHQIVERKYQDYYLNLKEDVIDENEDVHEERMRLVHAVMDTLPPQRRFIFEQCIMEGKSYKEVADIVELKISSIHKHISKVYSVLREALLTK